MRGSWPAVACWVVAEVHTAQAVFASESVATVIREIGPLIQQHWQEIAQYPDIALSPDFDQYHFLDSCGQLRIFTARVDGELIGYAIYLLAPALHYSKSLQAKQDVLFLLPEHRKSFTGMRLIAYADESLRKDGVQVVYHHVKAAHNFGPLLERMGYELSDLIYSRRLD